MSFTEFKDNVMGGIFERSSKRLFVCHFVATNGSGEICFSTDASYSGKIWKKQIPPG